MPKSPRCRRSPTATPRRGRNRGGGMSEVFPISTQHGNPTFHVSYRINHYVTLEELYEDIGIFSNQVKNEEVGIVNLVSQSHATVNQIDEDESEVGYYIVLVVAQDVDEYVGALEFKLRSGHRYYRHDTVQVKPVEWSPNEP